MVKALKALGKPVEWMPFQKMGHGFFWVRDEAKYLGGMLKFLDRYIGDRKEAWEDSTSKKPADAKTEID
jgi:dipeptidyl aminopeptidase/acylaminoacyl peptidase